jgi:hypothetical protein
MNRGIIVAAFWLACSGSKQRAATVRDARQPEVVRDADGSGTSAGVAIPDSSTGTATPTTITVKWPQPPAAAMANAPRCLVDDSALPRPLTTTRLVVGAVVEASSVGWPAVANASAIVATVSFSDCAALPTAAVLPLGAALAIRRIATTSERIVVRGPMLQPTTAALAKAPAQTILFPVIGHEVALAGLAAGWYQVSDAWVLVSPHWAEVTDGDGLVRVPMPMPANGNAKANSVQATLPPTARFAMQTKTHLVTAGVAATIELGVP